MFLLFLSLAFLVFMLYMVYFFYFLLPSRVSVLFMLLSSWLKETLNSSFNLHIFFFLFFIFLNMNFLSNLPLNPVSTMFYSFSASVSFMFWVSMMVCVIFTQLKTFVAHMMPYGAPMFLGLFLPLVEMFSQLIRPLTLMIRLSTNLSSGHIMMLMFSYFTTLSSSLSVLIYIILFLLLMLEFFISLLQAYIFVSLLSLYMKETF